jgi:hypothetical protein
MVIVGLSIYWSAFSKFLYVLATGFLIWFAFVNPVTPVICFAVMSTVLGIVMFAEDERRLVGKGHFLGALWWAGQAVVHLLSIHFARLDFSEQVFYRSVPGHQHLHDDPRGISRRVAPVSRLASAHCGIG